MTFEDTTKDRVTRYLTSHYYECSFGRRSAQIFLFPRAISLDYKHEASSYTSSFSYMQPRFSFFSGDLVPERKSRLEIVLILLDALLENLFAQRPRVFWI